MINRWALMMAVVAVAGCGTPTNNAGVSADPDSGVSGGGNLCNEVCTAQARVGCSDFTMGMCVSDCQAQYTRFPACTTQINAALRCAATATWMCSASNRPTSTSCNALLGTYLQCVSADAGP